MICDFCSCFPCFPPSTIYSLTAVILSPFFPHHVAHFIILSLCFSVGWLHSWLFVSSSPLSPSPYIRLRLWCCPTHSWLIHLGCSVLCQTAGAGSPEHWEPGLKMMKNMKMMKWSGVMEKLFSRAAVSAVCTKHEAGGAELQTLHTASHCSREEQHSTNRYLNSTQLWHSIS